MPLFWRSMRAAALAALALMVTLTLAAPVSLAQEDDTTVMIQGSLQLEALVRAIRDAYVEAAPDADVQIDPQGQSAGFDALCSGETDLVMATAPIADEVIARCAGQGQDFIETVLAYQAVVLLAPESAGLTCLSQSQVETLWSLGGPTDQTWADLGSATLTGPLTFAGPQASSPEANLLRALLPAGELRDDLQTYDDAAAVAAAVAAQDAPALGFVSLADYEAQPLEGTA
ncbi:MAG: substrate-binding domain-containing protein, partial [Chloroflexota bacterium]